MSLTSFFAVVRSMVRMAGGGMGVVSCFFVVTALVMFGRFSMMLCGVGVMFRRILMMMSCFGRHAHVSSSVVQAAFPSKADLATGV